MGKIIENHPKYIDMRTTEEKLNNVPKVSILIRELGDYAVQLRGSMWTNTVEESFEACSDVRLQIISEFRKNNILIPHEKIEITKGL